MKRSLRSTGPQEWRITTGGLHSPKCRTFTCDTIPRQSPHKMSNSVSYLEQLLYFLLQSSHIQKLSINWEKEDSGLFTNCTLLVRIKQDLLCQSHAASCFDERGENKGIRCLFSQKIKNI